jgi:hypothetical protein
MSFLAISDEQGGSFLHAYNGAFCACPTPPSTSPAGFWSIGDDSPLFGTISNVVGNQYQPTSRVQKTVLTSRTQVLGSHTKEQAFPPHRADFMGA